MKYLILEDEPFIAMDLKLAFEDVGHDAFATGECDEAHEAIEQGEIIGAVLDVNLGGGKTCEKAAATLAELSLPFVLHTGDLNRVGEFLRQFGAPIIEKPVPSSVVVSRLLDMTGEAAKRQAN